MFGASALTAAAPVARRAVIANAQTKTQAKAGNQAIYIGKGKYINDDPAKYPDRSIYTGGWAGGEAGLWQFRDEVKAEASTSKPQEKKASKTGSGNIYLGKGRFTDGDARKYANKDNVYVGGFAGGEEGLKMFVETGDIELLPEGQRRFRVPALLIGFMIALVGGAGSTLLKDGETVLALKNVDVSNAMNALDANAPSAEVALYVSAGLAVLGGSVYAAGQAKKAAANIVEKAIPTAFFLAAFAAATTYVISH